MSIFSLSNIGALTGNASADMRQMQRYMIQMNEQLKYVLGNIGEENFTQEVRQNLYAGGVSGKVGAEELDTAIKALEGRMEEQLTQQVTAITARIDALAARLKALDGLDEPTIEEG